MNRALQKKVYLDKATGLPNKNKCEELLDDPEPAAENVGVCSFDLNNLRRINNSMGHEAGDAFTSGGSPSVVHACGTVHAWVNSS